MSCCASSIYLIEGVFLFFGWRRRCSEEIHHAGRVHRHRKLHLVEPILDDGADRLKLLLGGLLSVDAGSRHDGFDVAGVEKAASLTGERTAITEEALEL